MADERNFSLKIKRDGAEDKWLRSQANGTASLISLIQMAIEQFGNKDINELLRVTSIKKGFVRFSVDDAVKEEIHTSSTKIESNLHENEKSHNVETNKKENKPTEFERVLDPDKILKNPKLS